MLLTVLLCDVADVGACEYINSTKTKGDFEDILHTEHSNFHIVYCPVQATELQQ